MNEYEPSPRFSATSEENGTLLGPEHIFHLTEFLARFASKWRLIGTALKFHPEDLDNIQYNNAVHVDTVAHNLTTLVADWVNATYPHTSAPTIGNLRKALRSEIVGLGKHANEALAEITTPFPHSTITVSLDAVDGGFINESCNHSRIQVTENKPVLLEVCVTSNDIEKGKKRKISYVCTWLKNNIPIRKDKDPMDPMYTCIGEENQGKFTKGEINSRYLHIKATDVDMDGAEFSCQIEIAKLHDNSQLAENSSNSGDCGDSGDSGDRLTEIFFDPDEDLPGSGHFYEYFIPDRLPDRFPVNEEDSSKNFKLIKTSRITLTVSCPSLDRFREGLASIYLAQPALPEDTWPPVSSKRYINLAAIRLENIKYDAKYARHTVRGGIDDILQHKEQITYEKVVSSLRSGTMIFIEGRPGCGKTTLVSKITRDWAISQKLGAMRLVLLVTLRTLDTPCPDLSNILKQGLFQNLKVSRQLIEERNGKGVCFILDGLDEYSPPNEKDSLIYKLINRYDLTESIIIVASRPAATAKFRGKANLVVEILGFQNDQIFQYLEHYPFSQYSKAGQLRKYLLSHPKVLHMCYLPIHTVMVAFLFEHTGEVPRTETEVYKHFTHSTLLRSLSKDREVVDIDVENLNEADKILFDQICALALQKTLLNKQVLRRKEIKSHFQTVGDRDFTLGLINVDRVAGLLGIADMYSFLHLTFQEYLAAYRISSLSNSMQHNLIEAHGHKSRMQVVWKFYCGLINDSEQSKDKFKRILKLTVDDLHKFHCVYESQIHSFAQLLLQHFHQNLCFNRYLTVSDLTAIGYVVANALEPISLSFHLSGPMDAAPMDALLLQTTGRCILLHSLAVHLSCLKFDEKEILRQLLADTRSLKCLQLSLDTETRLDVMSDLLPFCMNLTKLTLRGIPIHHKTLELILLQCKQLRYLTLEYYTETDEMKALLAARLPWCTNFLYLKVLRSNIGYVVANALEPISLSFRLSGCVDALLLLLQTTRRLFHCLTVHLSFDRQEYLRELLAITDTKSLKCLHLTMNLSRECGYLRQLVADTKSLKCLQLSLYMPFSDTETRFDVMSHLFPFCMNLTKLTLRSIPIHHKTLELILLQCKQLRYLTLEYNTGTDEMKALAACLPWCANLLELDVYCENKQPQPSIQEVNQTALNQFNQTVQHNRFSWLGLRKVTINECVNIKVAAASLANTLRRCRNIQHLDLSENLIENDGAKAIFTSIHTMGRPQSSLAELNLSGNRIGTEGARALSACLQYWPNLRKLDLSGNAYKPNIDRDGSMAVAENLHHCIQLTKLNLSYNKIPDEIAIAIIPCLRNCTKLSYLDLNNNHITSECKIRLCAAGTRYSIIL